MQQPNKNDIPEAVYGKVTKAILNDRSTCQITSHPLSCADYYSSLYLHIIEDLENRVADLYHNDAIIP